MRQLVKLAPDTKVMLEEIKHMQGFESLDETVHFLENVYNGAQAAGVMTITGGFPVFRK